MEILTTTTVIRDARGVLEEIAKSHVWQQLNRVKTNKGAVRGNHYHEVNLELHYILEGELMVHIRNLQTREETTHRFGEGSCFIVLPYEYHTLEHLTDCDYIVLFSRRFDPEDPDLHKDTHTYET
ncbi:cupin domain-containing protein [Candidatus Woesearchaeota archaeon]|nr:cupin domain-containing protein [Candidatus Woesearchaeota archaeon]